MSHLPEEQRTIEDWKAAYQSRQFFINRQREVILKLMMQNAVFQKLFNFIVKRLELEE